jgi:hypothetical protein
VVGGGFTHLQLKWVVVPGGRVGTTQLQGGVALIFRAALLPLAAAPGDPDHLPVHQGVGDLPPRFMEVAPEGLSGDPKGAGGRFLFEPRKIDEPEGLDLLGKEVDNRAGPPAEGAKTAEGRAFPDPPADPWSSSPPPVAATASPGLFLVHSSTIS